MNWYLKVLRQYADFHGRARRTEYWMFVLFDSIIRVVFYLLVDLSSSLLWSLTWGLYGLATFIPSLAVSVRRLHDIGKSGWWLLLLLLPPLIGMGVFVWFTVSLTTLMGPAGTAAFMTSAGQSVKLWFLLLMLIIFVPAIVLIVWHCKNSQVGANKWGANPKGVEA